MGWFRQLLSRRRIHDDLSAEIREHLKDKIDELVAGGMSRKDASSAARREFGNLTLIEEDSRAVWGWTAILSAVNPGLRRMVRPCTIIRPRMRLTRQYFFFADLPLDARSQ
jgi:hypothetical protein